MGDKRQADQVSLNIFDLINSICRDFRHQWKAGNRPSIEDQLHLVPDDARENLFRNLLKLDISGRNRAGESPSSDDYVARFPKYRRVVREEFDEFTLASMEGMQSTPGDEGDIATASFEMPPAKRIGDYEIMGDLGRGGFGVVYEAKHIVRGDRVALKTLLTGLDGQEINAQRLQDFRREFRTLSEINHPNLVGMQTLEVDASQWFLTMDLIDGIDFLTYVRPKNKLNEDRLRESLTQFVSGIVGLHEQRILHRDLKPSNVLIDTGGHVSILDFGLVAEFELPDGQTKSVHAKHFAGTPRYAAPEQLLGQRSPATDWYAFGTMLYEALVGEPPFRGSIAELLVKKREHEAPRLEERHDMPADLAKLTDQLLRPVPEERPDAKAICRHLAIDSKSGLSSQPSIDSKSAVHSIDGKSTMHSSADEPIIIGRARQLAQLEAAHKHVLNTNQPRVVWISGLSGEGKSSLVEAFLRPIRKNSEALVLSGRCFDRESIPFKAIDCWMDSLVSFLRSRSEEYLTELLPSDVVGLAQIFPVLRRVSMIETMPSLNDVLLTPEKLRYRAFNALRDLLVNISRTTPIVLFLDDLQWADADSVAGFQRILASPGAPPILLLGSYRSDERQGSPFLDRFDQLDHGIEEQYVEVGPLSEEEALELFARQLPDAAHKFEQDIRRVCRETGGNPYFVQQSIESFDVSLDEFRLQPLEKIIEDRLSRLPEHAKPLLSMLAVFGQPVFIKEASQLTGLEGDHHSTLTRMRNEKLIRLLGSGQSRQIETVHDKIRESVLEGLEDSDRRKWHGKIAGALEVMAGTTDQSCNQEPSDQGYPYVHGGKSIPRLFDLAYHSYEAGLPKALDYQLLAGEQALQSYSNIDGLEYFKRAEELLQGGVVDADGVRFRIAHGLGVANLRCRLTDDAIARLEQAVEEALTDDQRASAYSSLMFAHGNLGHVSRAIECGDQALTMLGLTRPRTTLGQLARMTSNIVKILLGRGSNAGDETSRRVAGLECQILDEQKIHHQEKSFPATLDAGFQQSVAGFQSGDPLLKAWGFSNASLMFSLLGWHRSAARFQRRFVDLRNNIQSLDVAARASAYEGFAHYFRADFVRSASCFRKSAADSERCGDQRTTLSSLHMARHGCAWSDTVDAELDVAVRVLRIAQDVGDEKAICWGWYDQAAALARMGRLTEALHMIDRAQDQFGDDQWYLTKSIFGAMKGYVLLQCSQYDQARDTTAAGWDNVKRKRMYAEYTVHTLPLLLESVVGPDWKAPLPIESRKYAALLNRWVAMLYRVYPPLQPLMRRTQGRLAASNGQNRKAARLFEKSIQVAKRFGMPYHRSRALLDLAAIKEDKRDTNRQEAVRILLEMRSVIPRAESWLLGDQYDEKVVAQEFDLEAYEREDGALSSMAGRT